MDGSNLEVFEDFVLSTSPANLTDANSLVNDCTKRNYLLGRFMKGRDMADMVQGGEYIKDEIYLRERRNTKNYKTNAKHSWQNPQVLTRWSIPWRFTMDHMSWTDQEIDLNNADLSEKARFKKYKDLKRSKEMNLWTGFLNTLEEQLWAQPDEDEMETLNDGGEIPNSLACFITEETDGVPYTYAGTEVMRIDVTQYPKWDNQRETYNEIGTYSTGKNLFTAFDKLRRKVGFSKLPMRGDLSERMSAPWFYACSDGGLTDFETTLRVNQNVLRWGGGQDPAYPHPTHKGVDVIYCETLDDAQLYDPATGTAAADESLADLKGGRFYAVDGRYMLKCIHSKRFFYKKRPFSPSNQPWNHIMPVDIWHNQACRSRQRQGIISPSADIAGW